MMNNIKWEARKNTWGWWDVVKGSECFTLLNRMDESTAKCYANALNIASSGIDLGVLVQLVKPLEAELRMSIAEGWPNGIVESTLEIIRPIANAIEGK